MAMNLVLPPQFLRSFSRSILVEHLSERMNTSVLSQLRQVLGTCKSFFGSPSGTVLIIHQIGRRHQRALGGVFGEVDESEDVHGQCHLRKCWCPTACPRFACAMLQIS